MLAANVPGLTAVRPGPDPYGGAYHRPVFEANKEIHSAWVLGALAVAAGLGILCTPIASIGGLVAGIFGLRFANRATQAGHPNGKGARVLNIVGIVLCSLHFLSLPFLPFMH